MLGIVSSCAITTLSLRRAVFLIFNFKYAVTLKTGLGVRQGHWIYLHSIVRIRLPIDILVTMALSCVVSEIFNVKNVVTLKSGSKVTQDH